MNRKVIYIVILLLILVMLSATVMFVDAYLHELEEWELIFIAIVFAIPTLFLSVLLIFDLTVGHREYSFEGGSIIVTRKGTRVSEIFKNNISDAVLIYDANDKTLCMCSFKFGARRYIISLDAEKRDPVLAFLDGIEYTERDNTFFYFAEYFLGILSAI